MERLLCALYEDEESAGAAVQRLIDSGVQQHVISAVIHSGEIRHEDLPLAANPTRRRSTQGAVLGAALGALLGGLLAGPAGPLIAGPLATALIGGAVGGLYGALAGGITSRDDMQPTLRELEGALQAGKVLVTVDVEGHAHERRMVRRVLQHMGGRPVFVT